MGRTRRIRNGLGLCLLLCLSLHPSRGVAEPGWADRVDPASGLTWMQLVNGEVPGDPFHDFVEPQRAYLRETYGEEVSTTYDLFRKERERAGRTADPAVLATKGLDRWPDPVVIDGDSLPGQTGAPLDRLRLYAFHLGRWVPVPYQFDEYTEDGRKVLPDGGPEANPEQGNGRLDPQDELLFMAHDLGDRVHPLAWVEEGAMVLEVRVRDPLDGASGWCYLVRHPGEPPPRSPLDYATYVEAYNQHMGFYVFDKSAFKVVGGKLYRQVFPQNCEIPDFAGGNATSFIDRVKFRTRVRMLFGTLKLTFTEDKYSGDTLAVRDGPIRCTRRCWGRMHLGMGIKTPKIVADIIQYDTMFLNPVELSVPINPGLVLTDVTLYSGNDLNASTYGSEWYNSHNLTGFVVDGRMSPLEQAMDTGIESWRLVTGAWGTMMNRALWAPNFKRQARISIRFTDDLENGDPPEYEEGQIGMAYNYTTVKNLDPGAYSMELDWYFIPWFHEGRKGGGLNREKVEAYMNMVDHPLEIVIGDRTFPNRPRPRGVRQEGEEEAE